MKDDWEYDYGGHNDDGEYKNNDYGDGEGEGCPF